MTTQQPGQAWFSADGGPVEHVTVLLVDEAITWSALHGGNGLAVSLSGLPCAGHPASAFLVDDTHVTPAALAAVRCYMDAAHAEYQAGRETRGANG